MKPQIHSTTTRKLPWLALCSLSLLILEVSLPAHADITVRISVKVILNPATGLRPTNVNDLVFSNTVAGMNALEASFGRGYRYQWVGNALIEVGGLGQFNTGPSQYYNVDFTEDALANDGVLNQQFESNAIGHPLIYGWDTNAVNLYVANMGGKTSGSVTKENHIFLIANPAAGHGYSSTGTTIHELGHHFSLRHTHEGEGFKNSNGSDCAAQDCTCVKLIGGTNDLVADTIADNHCWNSQDDIAQGNYGMNYAELTNARQAAADRVWFNTMSYHGDFRGSNDVPIFTSDQLDRWTDSANLNHAEVSGLTRFVDRNNSCLVPNGSSACPGGAGGPFATIANGISRASAGDIVLIRPGHYNEPMTITKAIALRATHGDALIGKP